MFSFLFLLIQLKLLLQLFLLNFAESTIADYSTVYQTHNPEYVIDGLAAQATDLQTYATADVSIRLH